MSSLNKALVANDKVEEQLLFKTIVGSQAYGTSVEGSDIDLKGVYIQNHEDVLTFNYKPQIEVGKDECYYEVRRFIELLKTANPTVLEMLYMPDDCVIETSPQFKYLQTHRDKFLTKRCLNSFGGYAVQQIQKARGLNKKMNWEKESMVRKTPLDFCFVYYNNGRAYPLADHFFMTGAAQEYAGLVSVDHIRDGYALYYDWEGYEKRAEPIGLKGIQLDDSNSIRLSSTPKGMLPEYFVHYNKDGYTQHCKAYNSYETWLKERNTQRYVDIEGHGQKIDGKNMLHCRRLLDMAIEIAETGTINVRRPNRDYLISIRKGEVDLATLLEEAEKDVIRLNEVYANCDLPEEVSQELCNEILKQIRYM